MSGRSCGGVTVGAVGVGCTAAAGNAIVTGRAPVRHPAVTNENTSGRNTHAARFGVSMQLALLARRMWLPVRPDVVSCQKTRGSLTDGEIMTRSRLVPTLALLL